jgi:acyl-CoA oxidase
MDSTAQNPATTHPAPGDDEGWFASDRPLLPFLPMVYVAWADGELVPEEIERIRARLETAAGLDERSRERLRRWLDPRQPPPAAELQAMLRLIRRAARSLGEAPRATLADLGRELARLSSADPATDEGIPPDIERAVVDLEATLGVVPGEAARQIMEPPPAEPVPPPEIPEPTFDFEALRTLLDTPYRDVRESVRHLLSEEEFRYRLGLPLDEYRALVLAWCQRLADEGLGAKSFPEAAGGENDLGAFIAVFETLAFHDISLLVKFGVQFGLFGGSILQLGTERHHREYLPRVASLELPGCFAMTERGHGSNVRDCETRARYLPESREFEIHTPYERAKKEWIGNAALHGRMATVFAQLEVAGEGQGVHAFLVPIRDEAGRPLPGVTTEDDGLKEGLNGVDNGRLAFDRVRVPRENLLDRFAQVTPEGRYESPIQGESKRFFTMLGTLVGGRISVAFGSLSAAKSGLTIAVRYGARRRQFGPAGQPEVPILDYLSHQRRLIPRIATAYAFDFTLKHLVEKYLERDEDSAREVETMAAGLKALASWFAVETLQTCRECCGGQGYLAENRLGPLKADLDVFTTFEGDNTVLLQLVAKGALTDFRKQFSGFQIWSLLQLLGHRASVKLTELNPVIVRRTDDEHLRDREFLRSAFRFREERLLSSAAGRLKHRIDQGQDSFQAFNEVQDHLLQLARAWTERLIVERFTTAVDDCDDASLQPVLADLCSLYGLWRMEQDMGWFLRSGYVEANKSRAIRDLNNRLCRSLRDQAVPLVDAFGIPEELLSAPIART